ncbi:transporter [Novosphingobium sp.]|uniref:transporter n=1 Tax=Novosphingobium sp. TaxID=1874826 RepID=UPI0025DDF603|nr:transporter [Novosphingobium sp.]
MKTAYRMHFRLAALAMLLLSVPAYAEDRDFCADRPGFDTPPCTLAPGVVMVETGLAAIAHTSGGGAIDDTLTFGDTLIRVGVAQSAEIEVGLTSYIRDRQRDASGISTTRGVGDMVVAVRRGIAGPNGPVALHAYVTLPTGKAGIGAGDWGAGLIVPMQFDLGQKFQLALSPEIDAAVNASGRGRHVQYGSAISLSHPLSKALGLTGELAAFRNEEPTGHETVAQAAASLAWQVAKEWQLDFEGDAGLSKAAPDYQFKLGFAHRFR